MLPRHAADQSPPGLIRILAARQTLRNQVLAPLGDDAPLLPIRGTNQPAPPTHPGLRRRDQRLAQFQIDKCIHRYASCAKLKGRSTKDKGQSTEGMPSE